jgi:hypothetical protein
VTVSNSAANQDLMLLRFVPSLAPTPVKSWNCRIIRIHGNGGRGFVRSGRCKYQRLCATTWSVVCAREYVFLCVLLSVWLRLLCCPPPPPCAWATM